jgi:hypothetical protein
LFALKQAPKFWKDKEGSTCIDSKFAFGVAHTFEKTWAESGLINSRGQDLIDKELIIELLESLILPEEIAVVYVLGHQGTIWLIRLRRRLPSIQNSKCYISPPLSRHHLWIPFSLPWRGPTREAGCFPNPRREMASSRWERSNF